MKKELKISQSSFSMFEKCSMSYKWQFIDELPLEEGADNLYAIFGTTFHKAMELYEKFGVACDDLVSGWKTLFLYYISEARHLSEKDFEKKDKFLQQGPTFIINAFSMIERWKKFQIVCTEKYVKFPFKNDFVKNVFLSGKIDLILKDDLMTHVCLDWKTSKSKEEDVDSNDQLTFYIFFIHSLFPGVPLDQVYGCLAYPYDKQILFTQRLEEDFENLFIRLRKMVERISSNDYKKEPKLNFKPDDCFFCPYKKRCEKC
jgi:CRISPR/Cas system-associated exonuclease Cas4 (RecB family)